MQPSGAERLQLFLLVAGMAAAAAAGAVGVPLLARRSGSLRTTVLRGIDGTVWHVPNGVVNEN